MVVALMPVVHADHLKAKGPEFGDSDELLHLSLLGIRQPDGVERQRRIAN
jgi:hypothetical protein